MLEGPQPSRHSRGSLGTCTVNLMHHAIHQVAQCDYSDPVAQATRLRRIVPRSRPRSSHPCKKQIHDPCHRFILVLLPIAVIVVEQYALLAKAVENYRDQCGLTYVMAFALPT